MSDLVAAAEAWIAGDPDPVTRAQLQAELDAGDRDALEASLGTTLTFGTAGIRGEVGPGSGRMNRAMVIKTTAGLASHLTDEGTAEAGVVVGYDARPSSRTFAEDAAGVLAASGIPVVYFPEVTPTPVVAFAAKHLGSGAAVVVTASHNPPADNGYKVYGANAAQIIPPEDGLIARGIATSGPAKDVPRLEDCFSGNSDLVKPITDDVLEAYLGEVDESRPLATPSHLPFVYTPMHGVGGRVVAELFRRSGHTGLMPVPEQWEPDGTFPTVRFPNPEEPGALDLALAQARRDDAVAILANDPDADRLAAAVRSGETWELLTGNDLGALLGDLVLRNWKSPQRPIVINSVVSSPILARIAANHHAVHTQTLTGFKWIAAAGMALENAGEGRFAFGFEEALGYTIGRTVRDKDGMSAALCFADLVAFEHDRGRTVLDRLEQIWSEAGLWGSAQVSLVWSDPGGAEAIKRAVAQIGEHPPNVVAGLEVTAITDYRTGAEYRAPWLGAQDLIELTLGEQGRVLVRPSGTEPKLKIYVDLVGTAGEGTLQDRSALVERARLIGEAVRETLGV